MAQVFNFRTITCLLGMAVLLFHFVLSDNTQAEWVSLSTKTNKALIKQKQHNTLTTTSSQWQRIIVEDKIVGQTTTGGWIYVSWSGPTCVTGSISYTDPPPKPSRPSDTSTVEYRDERCTTKSTPKLLFRYPDGTLGDSVAGYKPGEIPHLVQGYTYQMTCCYDVYEYKTPSVHYITQQTYALQLRIPLNQTVNPDKTNVTFVSDHLEFKDANGRTHYYHPTLSRVENNALVFEIPFDTSQGEVLTYPKIEYRITEFN